MKKRLLTSILAIAVWLSVLPLNENVVMASDSNKGYSQIIEDYIGAYEMVSKQQTNFDKILEKFPKVNREYASVLQYDVQALKYFLKDIDGDGSEELFIGAENKYSENHSNQWLFGVFTCKNNNVIDLFEGIGYRYNVYLLNDNTIWYEGSSSWQSFYGIRYMLNGIACNAIEELITEENDVWYYNSSQVSKNRADEILQEKRNKILYINWKSLYDFEREIKVVLNGEEIEFDQPPVMINNRVMVPMRKIFEELDYSVEWYNDTQTAVAKKDSNTITVRIGKNSISYGKGTYNCDVAPTIVSGRTLVPVRAISECDGCNVEWDGENYSVIITSKPSHKTKCY